MIFQDPLASLDPRMTVAQIIGEITTATAEQSIGIHHVNASVVQLDQMTQQNAAMVEQYAVASAGQREHADRLVELVSTFRLQRENSSA